MAGATVALDPYGTVYRFALFPAWEALMGRPTLARLRYLERTQWLSSDELNARQTASCGAFCGTPTTASPTTVARFARPA